ncbi:hypothetical protein NQ854_25385 [Rhodococcus ruber]|uniref:GIY-YIG nuclease family protein n=1 Tax=Rhodococcus ruber TaxID=1830 RepID=UPI00387DC3FA
MDVLDGLDLAATIATLSWATDADGGYRTYRTDWVLLPEDEVRLTGWMRTHLRLSWYEHPTPRQVEPAVVAAWEPPLNLDHTIGGVRELVETAHNTGG